MRLHITVDDDVVAAVDGLVGPRRRSGFITATLRRAVQEQQRWDLLEQALGSIPDTGHDWDDDPAAWVRAQRTSDARRVG